MAQIVPIAVNDGKAEIFRRECAGEDDRDVSIRLEHAQAIGFVCLRAAEGQVIIGRQPASSMLERAFGRLGVVDKLEISVVGEDLRR